MTPTICVLTHCPDLHYLYGTLTTLQTIRTGFPTAKVLVCDNGSVPEAQTQIRQVAQQAGASFIPLTEPFLLLEHHEILRGLILDQSLPAPLDALGGSLVILDGDLLFWSSCEDWQFEGLLAGRLIPTRTYAMTHATIQEQGFLWPRLHTSFWWIPDLTKLRYRIMDLRSTRVTWDPFTPWMVPCLVGAPVWYVGDTGCNLYGAIRNDCTVFGETQLNSYDHLFAGSTPALIEQLSAHPFPGYEWFPRVHAAAQRGEWAAIRGVWREQEAYFTGTGVNGEIAG